MCSFSAHFVCSKFTKIIRRKQGYFSVWLRVLTLKNTCSWRASHVTQKYNWDNQHTPFERAIISLSKYGSYLNIAKFAQASWVIEHIYHQNANTELKEGKFNILMLCDTYQVQYLAELLKTSNLGSIRFLKIQTRFCPSVWY